eukprot:4208992-Alexandrium_andersonii.AAC.1
MASRMPRPIGQVRLNGLAAGPAHGACTDGEGPPLNCLRGLPHPGQHARKLQRVAWLPRGGLWGGATGLTRHR